jgi:hypothetical protein
LFPTDNEEFLILYIAYIALFVFLLAGTLLSKRKKAFKNNLLIFSIYTLIMIFVCLNEDNFKYGGSLTVLFWGGIFLLLHLIIFVCSRIYIYFSSKQRKDKNS